VRETFRSLRNRNFKLYVSGQLVSVVGTGMQQVAQSWLVYDLTGSGTALGLIMALQFLPMLLFGVWGGLLADRLDKRRLLIATQAGSGALALVLWALVASGTVELWMVFVLAFLLGCVSAVDMPTRQSFVMEMVGREDTSNAVALNSATFNSGRLVGPAVAGVIIASLGVGLCFLVNGLSYLAPVAALRAMRPEELKPMPRAPRAPGQVREGLRYTWHSPALRTPLLLVTVVGTFGFNSVVVLPLLADESFGGGARLFGFFTSLQGLGALVGLATILVAAAPSAAVASMLLVATGVAMMVFLATANSTLQLSSDPSMRGRVMALYGLVFLGSTPVGGPIVGWVAEHWGPRAALVLGGGASLLAAVAAAAPAIARRRRASVRLRISEPDGLAPNPTAGAGVAVASGGADGAARNGAGGGVAVTPGGADGAARNGTGDGAGDREAPLLPAPGGGVGPNEPVEAA
jgi:MFS family permease